MSMVRTLLLCAFVSLWKADSPSYQRILLDERYNTIVPKDRDLKTILRYKIKASKGLIIDSKGFDFAGIRKMNDGKDPDRIHLLAKGGFYEIVLNPKGETIIDATTADIMKADRPFSGFIRSDTAYLAIGTLKHENGAARMMTYWIATIDVQ
jgi:hypothetical protein